MSAPRRGTRIEETARLCDLVENSIRRAIPPAEIGTVLDNIGLPYSQLNAMHMTNGTIGAGDADVMVSLKENHHPTAGYVLPVAHAVAARISRRDILISAGRYRHSNSQLWFARAHRYSDRRNADGDGNLRKVA